MIQCSSSQCMVGCLTNSILLEMQMLTAYTRIPMSVTPGRGTSVLIIQVFLCASGLCAPLKTTGVDRRGATLVVDSQFPIYSQRDAATLSTDPRFPWNTI